MEIRTQTFKSQASLQITSHDASHPYNPAVSHVPSTIRALKVFHNSSLIILVTELSHRKHRVLSGDRQECTNKQTKKGHDTKEAHLL